MTGRVDGKVALVSGGASGIGAATARLLVAEGAQVAIADVQREAGLALARELGPAATFYHLDVVDQANWRDVVDSTAKSCGRFDVLVNSAGIGGGPSDIETITTENWSKVMTVNATGTLLGCQNAVRAMRSFGNGGSIINVSSAMAIKASGAFIAYGASKATVTHLTKSVALHCGKARYNIRCNSVHPGPIDTPILDYQLAFFNNDRRAMLDNLASYQALGRVGAAEEIGAAILFLASDEAAFITAAEIVVDGGSVEL